MTFKTITEGNEKFALVPLHVLQKLSDDAEMLADMAAYDEAKERIASEQEEVIPFEVVERRIAGEVPVKIWREYRGLTQAALAEEAGISRAMIAAIETGNKTGSVAALKSIAAALIVDMDDLV